MAEKKKDECVKCGFIGDENMKTFKYWHCCENNVCAKISGADKILADEHLHKKCNRCGYECIEPCHETRKKK